MSTHTHTHTHIYIWLRGLKTRSFGSWFGNLQSLISLLKAEFPEHCISFRTAVFRIITQQVVAIPNRCFGTTYRTGCPETLAWNYHYLLHNNPEEWSSHLLRGRSLKSHVAFFFLYFWTWSPKIEWFRMWYIIIRTL